jgi:hypothetical protein
MPEANSLPAASNPVGRYPDRAPGATPKPRLLDRLREALHSRHYSRRTEQSYSLLTEHGNKILGLRPLKGDSGKYPKDWKEIMKSITGRRPLDG